MNNVEKLRDYFLGKDPQLKETMADNSLRLIGIEGKYFVLRTELIQRLKKLKDELTAVDEDLQRQINGVIHDLEVETQARINSDNAIGTRIDNLITSLNNYYTKAQINEMMTMYYDKMESDSRYTKKNENPFHKLEHDIAIVEANPDIEYVTETGWYYTGNHKIWWGDVGEEVVANENTLFYFHKDENNDNWIWINPATAEDGGYAVYDSLYYDLLEHKWMYIGYQITDIFTANEFANHTIPTTAGVINYVAQHGGGIESVSINYNTPSTALQDYVGKIIDLTFIDSGSNIYASPAYVPFSTACDLLLDKNMDGVPTGLAVAYDSTDHEWKLVTRSLLTPLYSAEGIDSTSTDNEFASAKAVYNFVTGLPEGIPEFELNYDDDATKFDSYIGQLVRITKFTSSSTGLYPNGTDKFNDIYYVETVSSETHLYGLRDFQRGGEVYNYTIRLNDNYWEPAYHSLQNTVTVISASSTNSQQPTAKAVYDFVKDNTIPKIGLRYDDSVNKFAPYYYQLVELTSWTYLDSGSDTETEVYNDVYYVDSQTIIKGTRPYKDATTGKPMINKFVYSVQDTEWQLQPEELIDTTNSISVSSTNAEYPTAKAVYDYVNAHVAPAPGDATRFSDLSYFNIANSQADSLGNITYQEFLRRSDNTLGITRTCSNPDTNGNYQTIVETFYKADGATINYTDTYAITYSSTGAIMTRTMTTTEV